MSKLEKKYNFPVVIEKDQDGYFAFIPQLQGCYTQGKTYEGVLENIEEAVKAYLLDLSENEEPMPSENSLVSFTTLEVAV